MIRRNKEGYFEAANQAGLTIFSRFKLKPETASALKKEMPLNLWKSVKCALRDDFGIDIIRTEHELREGVEEAWGI